MRIIVVTPLNEEILNPTIKDSVMPQAGFHVSNEIADRHRLVQIVELDIYCAAEFGAHFKLSEHASPSVGGEEEERHNQSRGLHKKENHAGQERQQNLCARFALKTKKNTSI